MKLGIVRTKRTVCNREVYVGEVRLQYQLDE